MSSKIAAQMYTVREFVKTEKDLAETLARLSKIGYKAVQLSAVAAMNGDDPLVSPALARKMLDDNGIKAIATHRSWDDLAKNTQKEIDFHHAVGCDYAAIGGLPGDYFSRGAEGFSAWVKDAKPVIAKLNAAGIKFGFHNHAAEFERYGAQRKTLYDILIDEGGPELQLEMDVYWVDHAGVNPVRVIERVHGRLDVIHIKDKEVLGWNPGPVMAPIGEGNLDWSELLPALTAAGTKWFAVEQDECRRDPFDCMRSSYEFLSKFKL
ncbi:MAG: sugar phosphate isomerase/epimerase [Capsulimonadaceae bacterium]|nr:sugar phosphate isomerase/epimerase [Capsulimonadaceae bacterium]